jgi:hypothetical protein
MFKSKLLESVFKKSKLAFEKSKLAFKSKE